MSVDFANPPKVGFWTKFLYGTGSIGYGVKDVAFRTFLLLYYNQIIGVRADLVSFAVLIALVVDAITDPVVGQLSDSLRTKWGRRHPFMFASALPASISFVFLFLPPAGMSDMETLWYIVVVGCLVRIFITFFEIPSSALAPELTSDYDERTSIASYRYFFGYLGGIAMAFLTLLIFLAPTAEYPVGQLNPEGYKKFALIGGGTMFVAILLSSFGTLHRVKYFKPPPKAPDRGAKSFFISFKQAFSNKGFLAIIAFGLLKYTSIGMTAALNIYFGTYLWGFNSAQLAILTLDSLLGAFLAMFLAPILSAKMGKRNAAFVLAIMAVTIISIPYLLRFNDMMFENGHPLLVPTVFAFTMLFQLCGVTSAVLTHAMIGDIVEETELKTGDRKEGVFYAANTLMQKSTSGLGVFFAGMLVTYVGLNPGSDPATVDPEIPLLLAKIYIPMLCGLYIFGAIFLFGYKIDRSSHEANVAALKRRQSDEQANADEG